MPTHYDVLQITPTATLAEIESAYDAQYNQWRRLVTHHDPNVVNQANQTLQLLEVAQTTLTDSTRRALYDSEIGVGTTAGGLADPTALTSAPVAQPRMPMAPPPPPIQVPTPPMAPQQIQQVQRPGLWACYKCGTDNPTGTKFCFSCSAQLVRECPECSNQSSLVATSICGVCGYTYDRAVQRRELRGQITDIQKEVVAYKLKSNTLIAEGNTLEQEQSKRVIPSALTALIGITFLFLGVFGSPGFRFPLSLLAIGMLVVAVRGIMRLRSGRNKLREMAREMDEIDAGNAKRANGIQQLQGEIDSLTINRQ